MALREPEIVRYSRQILLREIGGRGQEQLLAAAVELTGGSAALSTAAAYLGASGVRTLRRSGWRNASEAGFLLADQANDGGGAEDASRSCPVSFWMAEAPAGVPEAPRGRVLFGSAAEGARIVFGSAATAVDLLRGAAPVAPVPLDLAELVGALAALVVQRLILDIGPPEGAVRIDACGAIDLVALGAP